MSPSAAPPDRSELRRALFAAAPLADVIASLLAGEELHAQLSADLPDEAAEKDAVWWRLGELWARADPAGMLARLDQRATVAEWEALADRLRTECLLELGRVDEAEAVLVRNLAKVGAPWELLRARLDFARDRQTAALARLDVLLAGDVDVELRAAALSFRMRYRALAPTDDRRGAAEDRRALAALLEAHDAALSGMIIDVYGSYAVLPERPLVVRRKIGLVVEETKAALASGIDEDEAALGPLPLHVHALFVKLREQPARLADLAARLAGAEYLAGDRGAAYATLYYADQVGARVLGEARAEPLREAFAEICRLLGPEAVATYRAELRAASDEFLRSRRQS